MSFPWTRLYLLLSYVLPNSTNSINQSIAVLPHLPLRLLDPISTCSNLSPSQLRRRPATLAMDDIRDSERHGSASPTSNPPLPHDVNEGTSVPGRASPNVQATSAPAPSSETGGTPSSTETNHQAQSVTQQNDANHSLSTTGLGDSKDPLGEFDWNDLEVRFCAAMEGFKKIEDEISDEFKRWLDVCQIHSSGFRWSILSLSRCV